MTEAPMSDTFVNWTSHSGSCRGVASSLSQLEWSNASGRLSFAVRPHRSADGST